MEREKSEKPDAESNWIGKVSSRAFLRIDISPIHPGPAVGDRRHDRDHQRRLRARKSGAGSGRLAPARRDDRPDLAGPDGDRNPSHRARLLQRRGAGMRAVSRRRLDRVDPSGARHHPGILPGAGAGTMDAEVQGLFNSSMIELCVLGGLNSRNGLVDLSPAPQQSAAIRLIAEGRPGREMRHNSPDRSNSSSARRSGARGGARPEATAKRLAEGDMAMRLTKLRPRPYLTGVGRPRACLTRRSVSHDRHR